MERLNIVFFYLTRKINEKNIILKIINILNRLESLDYHIERYNNIKYHWLNSFTFNQWNEKEIYSYVLNSRIYKSEPDRILDFYNYTGISCQVLDLVFDLITGKDDYIVEGEFSESITDPKIKEWRREDDILYGKLAKKIMEKMKE